MPTYEYHCGHCDATYDLQEGFSAETRHRCKECKRGMAKRVLHVPQIVFKGSGFYATDNKSKTAARGEPATEGGSETDAPESGASGDKAG
ncbi:MAG: FmdB family zinc ribbon protein, partial [Dehalococcoidia bacterium]